MLDEGDDTLRATITLDEDRLTVETMSEERMDRVLSVVLEEIDGAAMVRDKRRAFDPSDIASARRRAARPAEVPDSPELRAHLEQWRDRMEVRWCEESIPALGGLTPREAAADPTRREAWNVCWPASVATRRTSRALRPCARRGSASCSAWLVKPPDVWARRGRQGRQTPRQARPLQTRLALLESSTVIEEPGATMCYMPDHPARVGVRELRQNLSVYLERVRAGERLEVTDRGHPVAALIPLPKPSTAMERLIATGRVEALAGDLLELAVPRGRPSTAASDALASQRDERL